MWSRKEPFSLRSFYADGPKHHSASAQAKDFLTRNICAEPGVGRKACYKSSSDFTRSEVPQEEALKSISFLEGVVALEEQEERTCTVTFFPGSRALILTFKH